MTLVPQEWPQTAEEERDLLRRMRAGDEAAFSVFARCYLPGLHRFALRRLGNDRELAREIVQITACRVVERLESYRGEAPFFTWLCACCRNAIAEHYRRLGRRPQTVDLPDRDGAETELPDLADGAPNPEESLALLESAEAVHFTLDSLPPPYARVLEWRYLEEHDVGEIARRLSSSYKSAESLLSRARRAFREAHERLVKGPAQSAVALPNRKRAAP